MSAFQIDLESLLTSLSETRPGGEDLAYDPHFLALERAGAGKPEVQYGDRTYPSEPPEWPAVVDLALELAQRTRDLRLAVWLVRGGARLHGLAGAAQGLALLRGLLERHWVAVHPQLDAADHDDPTMRLSAIAPLLATGAGLADLRSATVAAVRGGLTVRDLELGLGRAGPEPGESVPTEPGVLQALDSLLKANPEAADDARTAHDCGLAIVAALEQHLPADRVPDVSALLGLLKVITDAVARCRGGASPVVDGPAAAAASAPAPAAGAIVNREDAVRELERICAWIEHNQPSNPAPLLIRRAQRLINMSFMDIIRDMAPDSVSQVERLAGLSDQS
ncbi:MAG: type VI secretion system ImpA family N-terminal domain-containing protein [Rubrivivax sp.]|nr:type VI secretion system ImpA family N-terminal domain-containing protein [Rubrivivax sp.]